MGSLCVGRATHLVIVYALIRGISLLTWGHTQVNSCIALLVILFFGYICVKKIHVAWIVLISELLIGGAGHFFEFSGLILRTWFLGIFFLAWVGQKIRQKNFYVQLPRGVSTAMMLFALFLFLAILRGFYYSHVAVHIFQDAMLYFFLLLVFPALEYKKFTDIVASALAKSFIVGSAIFSWVTFIIYSSGLGVLPDTYYRWFRNVAAGKITDLGNFFFRVVLPEQLFIVPAILIIASLLLSNIKSKKLWALMVCALFILMLNFSRIYFLALLFGFVLLAYKQSFRQWASVCVGVITCAVLLFSATYFIASRGSSFGLELVGLRAGGVTAPQSEVSGAIRMALLPDILQTIKKHPLLGSGLGTPVTFLHPVTHDVQTRTQFDWGYLELIAELGILGTVFFLTFLIYLLYCLARYTYNRKCIVANEYQLNHGLFVGAVSFFVINLTTPALFQGFGILYFVFLITRFTKETSLPT